MQNRLITNNIFIVYELAHALRNRCSRKEGFLELKLDISKAYGIIEWSEKENDDNE